MTAKVCWCVLKVYAQDCMGPTPSRPSYYATVCKILYSISN